MRTLGITIFLLIPGIAAAELDLDEAVYRHKELALELHIPEEWTPSDQTGYPAMLLLLTAPKGKATISLTWGALTERQDLAQFVSENRKAMTAVGIKVSRVDVKQVNGRRTLELDAVDKQKDQAIRQLYLQQGRNAYIFTLTCPPQELLRRAGELPFLLKGLTLAAPPSP